MLQNGLALNFIPVPCAIIVRADKKYLGDARTNEHLPTTQGTDLFIVHEHIIPQTRELDNAVPMGDWELNKGIRNPRFDVVTELFAIHGLGKQLSGDLRFSIEVVNEPQDGFTLRLSDRDKREWSLGVSPDLLAALGRDPVVDVIRETVRQIGTGLL
jgi:hypothetical protein